MYSRYSRRWDLLLYQSSQSAVPNFDDPVLVETSGHFHVEFFRFVPAQIILYFTCWFSYLGCVSNHITLNEKIAQGCNISFT